MEFFGTAIERGRILNITSEGARVVSMDRPGLVTKPLKALFKTQLETDWPVIFLEFEDGTGAILSHMNAEMTNGVSEQEAETLAKQIIDRLHPVGSLYASVQENNPCELLGGVWVNRGSLNGVTDENIVWKRIALPTFEVIDGELMVHLPEYSGDSRLDACICSINDDGILTITMPDDLTELTFHVNNQGDLEVNF